MNGLVKTVVFSHISSYIRNYMTNYFTINTNLRLEFYIHMTKKIKILSLLVTMVTTVVLSSCVTQRDFSQMSEEELYEGGSRNYTHGAYDKSVDYFNALQRLYPYSPLADQSLLLSADARYYAGKYPLALVLYTSYSKLNPESKNTPYAYYMRGMSYYNVVSDIYRDQTVTRTAIDAFEEVIQRFPNSVFARKAHIKVDLLFDILAGKELSVGRYYQNQKNCLPAINRYKEIAENYSSSIYIPEALYRMSECQIYLGLNDEAFKTIKVLGYNYNDSSWYNKAYKLLVVKHLLNKTVKKPKNKSQS